MMRRTLRSLPSIRWRDEKIQSWREQARAATRQARAAEQSAADKVRAAEGAAAEAAEEAQTARRRAIEAERQAHSSQGHPRWPVVQDAPHATPRVQLTSQEVAQLKREGHLPTVGSSESDPRAYPSFVTQVFEARRYRQRLSDQGLRDHPRREIPKKLQNFALAASHGIQPPEVLKIWRRPDHITFEGLPDSFVVKSNGGAGGRGVHPLRRVAGETNLFEIADTSGRQVTGEEVIANLTTDSRLSGPWFAEEFLFADVGDSPLPSDIKIYAFYGQVGYGFARRAPLHRGAQGWNRQLQFRYFDGHGQDIEMRAERSRRDIPLTPALPDILEAARTLSLAVPLPFVRVDVYGTTKGIVMGEITLLPGGDQYYPISQDVRLGKMWEEARMRLEIDLARKQRPFAILAGEHSVPKKLQPYLPARP